MISAEVIADSVSEDGDRLTTVLATCHRFVLAELNTHRAFSRNSASSRAIPVKKQMAAIRDNLAVPVEFGSTQPGMQAGPPLKGFELRGAQNSWRDAAESALVSAEQLLTMDVHKQIANRVLEPFMWHTVVLSATEWENFYTQRISPLAQPEINALAIAIKATIDASKPETIRRGFWHLPFIHDEDHVWANTQMRDSRSEKLQLLRKISVARCARTSYLTHEGVRDQSLDVDLYDKLITAQPPHWSPLEHVATPDFSNVQRVVSRGETIRVPKLGNFLGWVQLRHWT